MKKDIQVRFHSGYRGAETPRSLLIKGREMPVERILERRRELTPDAEGWEDVFRCRAGGRVWLIRLQKNGRVTVTADASRKT